MAGRTDTAALSAGFDDAAPARRSRNLPLPEWAEEYFRGFAWTVFIPAVALTLMGIYAIGSAKPEYAKKQFIWLVLWLAVFAAVSIPNYRRLARWSFVALGVCLVLLLITLFMPARGGARRWIFLGGFGLQPSELTKIAFIAALAEYLRYRENYRRFTGLLIPFLIAMIPMALILKEPDLGTSLLFLPTLYAMLFAAGAKKRHLIGIFVMAILALPVFWMLMRDYQKTRVAVLVRQFPEGLRTSIRTTLKLPDDHLLFGAAGADFRFRTNEGHQLTMSLETIREGQLFGDDDGEVGTTLGSLPENHTDFVFAVWAKQTGFLGGLFLLAVFLFLLWAGLNVAMTTPDPFGRLMAVGITGLLATQLVVNVGMTIGLMPITGLTLPFVSYGGTSLLTSYIALGLLINISRRRPFLLSRRAFEFGED